MVSTMRPFLSQQCSNVGFVPWHHLDQDGNHAVQCRPPLKHAFAVVAERRGAHALSRWFVCSGLLHLTAMRHHERLNVLHVHELAVPQSWLRLLPLPLRLRAAEARQTSSRLARRRCRSTLTRCCPLRGAPWARVIIWPCSSTARYFSVGIGS